jgi:hypothetical protein
MSDDTEFLKTKSYIYCDNDSEEICSNYSDVKKIIHKPKKCNSNKHKKKSIKIDFNINDNYELIKNSNKINNSEQNEHKYQNIYIFQCNCHNENKTNNLTNNVNLLFCNYNEEIKNNEFIGNNIVSKNFLNCAYFLPFEGIIKKIAINIKSFQSSGIYTIRLYINGKPTSVNTSILDGSDNLLSISETFLEINSMDLLSFRSEFTNDNVLKNGISITLVYCLKN